MPRSQRKPRAQEVTIEFDADGVHARLLLDGKPQPRGASEQELVEQVYKHYRAREIRERHVRHLIALILNNGLRFRTRRQAGQWRQERKQAQRLRREQPHTARLLDGLRDEHGRPGQQPPQHRHVPIDTLGGARVPKHRGNGRDRRAHAPQR